MKTLALVFILMVALSVTHGRSIKVRRRLPKVPKKSQYVMKTWIIRYFDWQLDRFLKMTKGRFKLTPTQVKVLRYVNRRQMVRNCSFYQKYATFYLWRRRRPLTEKNYAAMGRYIGFHVRMSRKYYLMIKEKRIPKLTKFMEKTLAKKPGDIQC
ncbi:egg-lysin-like [Haliotis asinina]|uniref:egg-lysin-like n=1 Tax=Haliotis asinina TaxID=109174 RepID=UPI0035326893